MTNDSTKTEDANTDQEESFTNPYEEELVGETKVTFQCDLATTDDLADSEGCDHEPMEVELDEPAFIGDDGRIHLPGRPENCPECGNPHGFLVNGLWVGFDV